MKSKQSKLIRHALALLVVASIATPASAAWNPYWYWNWQPSMNVIQASRPSTQAKPTTPATPSAPATPTAPSTPSTPTTPTAPTTPATPTTPTAGTGSVSALERQVVTLVNQKRAAAGLKSLTLNATLSNGARMKSQDMQKSRYFSHTSPNYGSPFDMMRSLGISYRSAGENIAMGYSSAEAVVNAWMNSPSHRANIMNASYTQIGVGYVSNGGYWTQWFIS